MHGIFPHEAQNNLCRRGQFNASKIRSKIIIVRMSKILAEFQHESGKGAHAKMKEMRRLMVETTDDNLVACVKQQMPDKLRKRIFEAWNRHFVTWERAISQDIISGKKEYEPKYEVFDGRCKPEFDNIPQPNRSGNFLQVGCGANPHTMLWLAGRHQLLAEGVLPFRRVIGIDCDLVNVRIARKVMPKCVQDEICGRFNFVCERAERRDYGDDDVIHVGCAINGQSDVLERILTTAKPGAILLKRVPQGLSIYQFECHAGAGIHDSRVQEINRIPVDPTYHTYVYRIGRECGL